MSLKTLQSLQDLSIQKFVFFLDLSKVDFLNLNLGIIDIWDQLILDCMGLFYALRMFSIDLCLFDTDSILHSPALWQTKISPDVIKCPVGSKTAPIREPLH